MALFGLLLPLYCAYIILQFRGYMAYSRYIGLKRSPAFFTNDVDQNTILNDGAHQWNDARRSPLGFIVSW